MSSPSTTVVPNSISIPSMAVDMPHKDSNNADTVNVNKKAGGVSDIRNSLIAGSIAGMTSCLLFHPLDVIRTKMQTTTQIHSPTAANTTSSTMRNIAQQATHNMKTGINASSSPMTVLSHTLEHGGIRSLYTGLSLPLAAQALYKATVLTTNRYTKQLLLQYHNNKSTNQQKYELTWLDYFICGSTSGIANALIFVAPVEYVRAQLIAQHTRTAAMKTAKTAEATKVLHGPVDVILQTIRTRGIFGLWTGAGVTVVRDSIGCGSFFVMYELGQKFIPELLEEQYPLQQTQTLTMIGSGFMAGFGYWTSSLPLDALKTLVQSGHATSAREAFTILIRRDGLLQTGAQLYRGCILAISRGAPAAFVSLSMYNAVYGFLTR